MAYRLDPLDLLSDVFAKPGATWAGAFVVVAIVLCYVFARCRRPVTAVFTLFLLILVAFAFNVDASSVSILSVVVLLLLTTAVRAVIGEWRK